ncbi:MAG: hypothetical protein RL026_1718 [Pseudomonadota bacterium]|jgi:SAM-dependent methyltransferase
MGELSPPPLRHWWDSPLGQEVLQSEARLLHGVLDGVFGLELLQLGDWGASRELLAASRTRRQTILAPSLGSSGAVDILASPAALPLPAASVDAVLLPHTLEFVPDPHAVVREADRVLVGDGRLLVLGFCRGSLWGARAALAPRQGYPPGLRQLLPERRVRDWLALLGYEMTLTHHHLPYRPWTRAWLLSARKRLYTPTPLRPRLAWGLRRRRRALVPQPTSRNPG